MEKNFRVSKTWDCFFCELLEPFIRPYWFFRSNFVAINTFCQVFDANCCNNKGKNFLGGHFYSFTIVPRYPLWKFSKVHFYLCPFLQPIMLLDSSIYGVTFSREKENRLCVKLTLCGLTTIFFFAKAQKVFFIQIYSKRDFWEVFERNPSRCKHISK